jgi:AcrR family transcriptional regulator
MKHEQHEQHEAMKGASIAMADTAPMRRRTRKAGRQKPEILDAVVRVITERGIEGTRFADVSEATGVPIASLQYYFGSREDLLVAAFRHGSNASVTQIRAALEAISDPTERILYVIDVHCDMYDPASDSSVLLSEEFYRLALRDPELQLDLLDEYRRWREMIADAVRLGIAAGQFAPETDPDRVAVCLYAFMEGICQPMAMGDPALPRETVRQLINEYMGIVLPATSSRPSTAPPDRPRRVRS